MDERAGDAAVADPAEVARLRGDLLDAREQLAATSEILTAMGRSVSDVRDADAVLGTIVESARTLCRADAAYIQLLDGGVYRLARSVGLSEEFRDYIERKPATIDARTVLGRVSLGRQTLQIPDVLADPGYGRQDMQEIAGYRTLMGAPLLLEDDVVGVLSVYRGRVEPFDERATALLTAFAVQAAIAIRHVDLVRSLGARSAELGRKVDQLEALREVGEAVASTLDLDEVLSTIVANAVHLSGTDGGSMMEFEESERRFFVRTAYGTSPDLVARLRDTRIDLDATFVGRSALQGRPLQLHDLEGAVLDPHLRELYDAGWRSLLAVPMLREGGIVGALIVRRRTPGDFSAETCELLQTFAGQSALAIVNARLFRELEVKSSELAVASRHKSEFLASMSHELRTPLNAVIGFSEVLLERMFGDINDRQEDYLRDIWSSGKHLLELLNEVLDLSKVEAGRMDLEPSVFSMPDLLESSLSMMRERAARHAITLQLEVDPAVGVVASDPMRVKQVLLNLLSNAVKFTPDGGSVILRAVPDGSDVVIAVRDTGIGVPEADRERIFESFQQGGRAAPKQEGTGLGLTLSRRIVGLLGGRLWLESEVGAGSTFRFSIPVGLPSVHRPAGTADPAGPDAPRVVLIEDDPRSLELMVLYLEDAGVRVITATDGRDALEAVSRHRPHAVILDIRLPGMDGWDILAALKADAGTAALPVIVVSIVDERARGLALGAAAYLVKPVGGAELIETLERVGVLGRKVATPASISGQGSP